MKEEFYTILIRTIFFNISTGYAFLKAEKRIRVSNKEKMLSIIINIMMAILYSTFYTKANNCYVNKATTNIICYIIYVLLFSAIINKRIIGEITISIISIAISLISLIISTGINFVIMKVCSLNLSAESKIEYTIIGIVQITLIYLFFRINRFKDGFQFIRKKNKIKIISIFISLMIVILGIGLGIYSNIKTRTIVFVGLVIGGILMFYWIKKSITKYYKEKMKERTVEIQQEQIKEKDETINNLKTELEAVLQINHKYSQRISAMEKAVSKLAPTLQTNEEFAEEYGDVLNYLNELSKEYREEVALTTKEIKLPKTNIFSIDNLLEYMKKESEKEKIEFDLELKININEIIENKIAKNKLETILTDHIRDAIIAIKNSENKNRKIKVVFNKEENYQIEFYDTGIEFEIDTLLKLGLERTTTHKATGGTGIGFITTFETLKECKASLDIKEFNNKQYTKAIVIEFDNKNEYRIHSYRAEKIKNKTQNNRIKIYKIN